MLDIVTAHRRLTVWISAGGRSMRMYEDREELKTARKRKCGGR